MNDKNNNDSSHDSGHICVRERREVHVKTRRGAEKCGHGTGKNALTFVNDSCFTRKKMFFCMFLLMINF